MPLSLTVVKEAPEFSDIWPVLFEAYQKPYNPFFKHFNPIHTTEQAALQASKERHIKQWYDDLKCHWIKITDTDTEDVIGAACWLIHDQPALDEVPGLINAYWHEEGSVEKRFAEKLIGEGLGGFITKRMAGKRYCGIPELDQIIVHSKHRNRGAARMMIKWGTDIADEMGFECVIGSTPFARAAYERCGFTMAAIINPDLDIESPCERWKEYQMEDLHAYMMWRPVGHDFVNGQGGIPFEDI
ncbi:uncharacterized protein BDR25DRAFT_220877 [Lindgomyces ingoldianus]|uniref:Uncharacterized protein n=1 Tax=Lindgomyces ingoldianus TaxID=673940 RepID=A0ACB6R222_9PLEO|nr:uncharacterized protein BDR25DRAFT_220877 [Lindgomyces ingoldianus]KAF2472387.1 hypothetical protein BDR25DRAFT_220877 [Lindgomyces ingoldianus]